MTRNNWFARTARGRGWTPITWQGWALAVSLILVPLAFAGALGATPSVLAAAAYGAVTAFALFPLLWMAILKGPAPQWRYVGQDD
ncbi:hypothetical protein [Nocardioides jejuensis]|uniref:Uncharacterized protein n=1 Tax=Nocardioides jejuensis TaxID=2502782 RepID=A0A4R1C146_9ACTN|nr:hypothetical protein [Nocardioides jejuensis]TCJ24121.1 hypothetical protein EPD65_09425 [Nocardioides jejuensis]